MGRQHTPGEWRFDEDGEVRAYAEAEYEPELLDNIALVYNEADGPLIAAAPALLKALRFYVAICGNTAFSVDREAARQAYNKAIAAILSSQGETE